MQEPLFQALRDVSTAVLAFDPTSRLVWANPPALSLANATYEALKGKAAKEILPLHLGLHASLDDLEHGDTPPLPNRLRSIRLQHLPLSDGSSARLLFLEPAGQGSEAEIFHVVLQNTVNFVTVVDDHGVITLSAPSVRDLLGYPRELVVGKPLRDLILPEDQETLAELLRASPSNPQSHVHNLRLRHRNGEIRVFEARSVDLRLKASIGGFVVLARDISQRLRAEEAVRESELRYRRLFDQSRDIVSISDQEGRLIDVNRAGIELLGYEHKDEILSIDIGHSVWGDPEARSDVFKQARTRGYTEFETQFLTRQGEARLVSGTMVEMRDDHGKPEGYLAIVRDVTDQRQVEDQLRQSQKMEAIGRLAGGIAHDFNNLLTAIGGYCDLLLDEAEDDETRFYVREIEAAGERASALTAKLLTLSRREPVTPKIIDLNELIRDLQGLLRRLIGEDIQMSVALSNTPAYVQVDSGQLEHAILNLAANARDAMPQGGQLTQRTELTQAQPNGESSASGPPPALAKKQVCLTVSDTGIGMDTETLQHIYEPFFTTKEAGKGTGLGLATVYATVHRFGGSIEATSRPGEGTAFCISLPNVESRPSHSNPDKDSADKPTKGHETILLVEDDDTVRQLVMTQLKRQGYQVLTAPDGESALGQISEAGEHLKLDLLVSDVVMPGMSGPELAVQLRQQLPALPILFISGYTGAFMVQHGFCEGKDQVLHKPFTAKMLAERVRALLDAPADA